MVLEHSKSFIIGILLNKLPIDICETVYKYAKTQKVIKHKRFYPFQYKEKRQDKHIIKQHFSLS